MSYSNLATELILSGNQDNMGQPQGGGFPFLKFSWDVVFSGQGLDSTPPLVAKTCELPRWSTDTQIINVYNHKTLVQTKLTYEPITISFYDQCNKAADSVIWGFVHGQFDCTDGSKKPEFKPFEVKITQKNLSGEGSDKIYTLKNVFITDAQHDTLDYSSSDVVLWTVTLRYEDLETEFCDGATPGDGGTGIAPAPAKQPESKPTVTNDAKNDVPNGWVRNGGASANNKDPLSAAFGVPRGRLGIHKLPGDVGYDPNINPIKPGSLASRVTTLLPDPHAQPSPIVPKMFMARSIDTATPQFVATVNIPLDNSTAQESLYDPSTGTVTPAVDTTFPNRDLASKQSDFLGRLQNMPDFKASTVQWQTAFLDNFNPLSNSPKDLQSAVRQAQRSADAVTQRYAPEVRVVDREVIYNTALAQQKEAVGPAVVNGYSKTNINDTKSTVLSSQQATRQQTYQIKNPLKGNSTIW